MKWELREGVVVRIDEEGYEVRQMTLPEFVEYTNGLEQGLLIMATNPKMAKMVYKQVMEVL